MRIYHSTRFPVAEVLDKKFKPEEVLTHHLKLEGGSFDKIYYHTIIENVSNIRVRGLNLLMTGIALCMLDRNKKLEVRVVSGFEPKIPGQIVNGKTYFAARQVAVSGHLPPEEFAGVLLHEFSHYLTHIICKNRSSRENIRDFAAFRKAFGQTVQTMGQMNSDDPAHGYIKGIVYDRIKRSHTDKQHGYMLSEFFAQIPVLLMLRELMSDGKKKTDEMAGPLMAFYEKKAVPALEKFISNHPEKHRIQAYGTSEKRIEI